MAKEKRAAWWKMFYHQRAAIESVSDADAGAGLKAAFRYFGGEAVPPGSLTPQAFTVFCVIRPYIDESKKDYETFSNAGRKGMRSRWGRDNPLKPPSTPYNEAEAEAEADSIITPDGVITTNGAKKPFTPPTPEEVRAYCRERKNGIDPESFIDFYASKGWMVGRNKMADWKAAVRQWERRRQDGASSPFTGAAKREWGIQSAKLD